MSRPKFGESVLAADRLVRRIESRPNKYGSTTNKVWRRYGDVLPGVKAKPVAGMYVGFRTYVDGYREWDSEAGYAFYPERNFEVWMIIPNERQNAIPVFPDDVTVDARQE